MKKKCDTVLVYTVSSLLLNFDKHKTTADTQQRGARWDQISSVPGVAGHNTGKEPKH